MPTAPEPATVIADARRLIQSGQPQAAAAALQALLAADPSLAEAHKDLGVCMRAMGRQEEAEACYRAALTVNPDYDAALNNLGNLYRDRGDYETALDHYRRAMTVNPGMGMAHYNAGTMLTQLGMSRRGVVVLQEAIRLMPAHADAHRVLGYTMLRQGLVAEARPVLQRAIELGNDDGVRISEALALPTILPDAAAIPELRQRYGAALAGIVAGPASVLDPVERIVPSAFLLAYHGQNDKGLMQALAAVYRHVAPSLVWEAPHCRPGVYRAPDGPLRIAMVSRYFNRHIVGTVMRGLVQAFDRKRFHITLFNSGGTDEKTALFASGADGVRQLPPNLAMARERIAAGAFDAVLYPEIGMDALTYCLAHARLAPVQAVFAGHPDTTGLPTMDYFLSSRDFESAGAQAHYSERLISFAQPPVVFERPVAGPGADTFRPRHGLPQGVRLYVCPQTLFKFHPDFDAVLAAILQQDPDGRLVIINSGEPTWLDQLLARLRSTMGTAAERIIVLPGLPFKEFLHLLLTADALLDPLHFGGGTTSFAAFAMGVPIVTLPGAYMRGRVTAGMCRRLGVTDTIATDPADYVAKALRLAHDKVWRDEVGRNILARADCLFEDVQAVRDLEDFLSDAVTAASTGGPLPTRWLSPLVP